MKPSERLLEAAKEMGMIARGAAPAARMHIAGHAYVPEKGIKDLCQDGSPLVTDLISEVDRAVKQASREGGRYDTTISHILKKHLVRGDEA